MQIGIRLHDVAPGTIEERLKIAREQGFSCVHLALTKTINDHSVENSALTPGFASYLRNKFGEYHMDIAVLGCYLNLAHPDPEEIKKIQERYFAHLRFASILGCSVVGTETGNPNPEYRFEPASHTEEALQTFITNFRPVVECAEKFGVIMAIEPVWSHIVYNSKQALKVLKAINSPNLRIILDPVNLLSVENSSEYDKVIQEAIEDLGEYTDVLHMKDFVIEGDKVVSGAPGTGVMKYDTILNFAKKDKPYIQMTIEDSTPDNAEWSRKFLENYSCN
ncbi:sugar phosphate isomerase/epimerase family protein [Lacrimispora defluvii]|uniref:Sugar phosphate isomerase/epimerase n=1 Tax=Lacrimispora defluvii TaxID=2719233 RepID=A0ABX1VWR5_9FIRM|nr:sugar phosphate isomerase/epimerase [Lacrimispora defluvii]NNJ32179.1 sugar phosphate isomerase/epimerase [Lacrimispora defluvii]